MNQKKKLKKYIYDMYQFDLYREELIHKYLCKEKLKRKQLRQLSANVKFEHYKNWKDYIIKKYSVCDKDSLIEFDKLLNLLLQQSKSIDDYSKYIWTSYISSILSVLMTMFIDVSQIGSIGLVVGILLLPLTVGLSISKIYNEYAVGEKTILFLNDVKEIVQEMIKTK